MATEYKKMLEALWAGKIVAIEEDPETGKIEFGGAFESDNDAALAYSADSPEALACLPNVSFIKKYNINPNVVL